MLKEKEIQTLKRQMDILRERLLEMNEQSGVKKQIHQEMIEERKSESKQQLSFEDSELKIIEQKENPYLELAHDSNTIRKTLQRSDAKTGS